MSTLFQTNAGATFSPDRKHRLVLWRIWDDSKPMVAFIGLNPSTANETEADPTIRRVIAFAQRWGYGGVYMLNLYTYVTPYPWMLEKNDVWEDSLNIILEHAAKCEKVVAAWGDFTEARERGMEVRRLIGNLSALVINKNGTPRHPLYVKADVELKDFSFKTE